MPLPCRVPAPCTCVRARPLEQDAHACSTSCGTGESRDAPRSCGLGSIADHSETGSPRCAILDAQALFDLAHMLVERPHKLARRRLSPASSEYRRSGGLRCRRLRAGAMLYPKRMSGEFAGRHLTQRTRKVWVSASMIAHRRTGRSVGGRRRSSRHGCCRCALRARAGLSWRRPVDQHALARADHRVADAARYCASSAACRRSRRACLTSCGVLVGQLGGRRAGPRAVDEAERAVEADVVDELHRRARSRRSVSPGKPTMKSDDSERPGRAARSAPDDRLVLERRVAALHRGEHAVGARLHRQVQVRHELAAAARSRRSAAASSPSGATSCSGCARCRGPRRRTRSASRSRPMLACPRAIGRRGTR